MQKAVYERCGSIIEEDDYSTLCYDCLYELRVELERHNILYEESYNNETGEM